MRISLLGLMLVLVGGLTQVAHASDEAMGKITKRLNPMTKAEFWLQRKSHATIDKDGKNVGPTVKIISDRYALKDVDVIALKTILADKNTYAWNRANGCMPNYGAIVQFSAEGKSLKVSFCMVCKILKMEDGKGWRFGEDFDEAEKRIRVIFARYDARIKDAQ